ncbi:MAG: hypothetical protein WB608_25885 [Terracidiphilus sp.]
MISSTVTPWSSDWVWSLPLTVVTVVFHAFGLGLLNRGMTFILKRAPKSGLTILQSVCIVGGTALCATLLHSFEGFMWAIAYLFLGAMADWRDATLYSLSAMTTYGHSGNLLARWQLMGSLEALNGWIVFGLTTAFLFTVIQEVWSHRNGTF